jgi:hypothetical protein
MLFTFPEDARWNAEPRAAEFGVEIGEYRGRRPGPAGRVQRLPPERLTPSGAWKPTTSGGPGSSVSPSANSAAVH